MNNVIKKVVLISTRRVEESIFPISGIVFNVKLATFLIDKYQLNEISFSDDAKLFLEQSKFFISLEEMDDFEYRISVLNEDISVVEDIVKRLKIIKERYAVDDNENNKPIDESFNQLSSLINEINQWLNNHQKSKTDQPNSITANEAKNIIVYNKSLYEYASFYKYHSDKGESHENDCVVLGVMELKKPDRKNALGSWEWVKTLEDAIKDLFPNVQQIILLLHDKDLYEFQGHDFQFITFEAKQGTSLAVFRHTFSGLDTIFSGTLKSQQVFDELYNMLSSPSKRQEYNESNAVSNGYLSLIK